MVAPEVDRPGAGGTADGVARSPWLPLGAASRLVGVDPDTLRRWADTGRVRAFTTPGGHRRFDRRDLDRLVLAPPAGRVRGAGLGMSAGRIEAALRRRYRRGRTPPRDWLATLDERERNAFRERGRKLQAVLLAHLDGRGSTGLRAEAERLGGDYGAVSAELGLPLGDAVSIFQASRAPLLSELIGLAARRRLGGPDLARLVASAADVLDYVLLALVEAHRATGGPADLSDDAAAGPLRAGRRVLRHPTIDPAPAVAPDTVLD